MPLYSRKNLYRGVNAHLHSRLQGEPGGWEVFHSAHIIHLGEAIGDLLPPGYLVEPEKSMQIRAFRPDSGEPTTTAQMRRPQPDITIYHEFASEPPPSGKTQVTTPTLTLPAVESIPPDAPEYLTSLVIYRVADTEGIGTPVTWVELLSPTNKPPGVCVLQRKTNCRPYEWYRAGGDGLPS
jgi:hypothetical protein